MVHTRHCTCSLWGTATVAPLLLLGLAQAAQAQTLQHCNQPSYLRYSDLGSLWCRWDCVVCIPNQQQSFVSKAISHGPIKVTAVVQPASRCCSSLIHYPVSYCSGLEVHSFLTAAGSQAMLDHGISAVGSLQSHLQAIRVSQGRAKGDITEALLCKRRASQLPTVLPRPRACAVHLQDERWAMHLT